MHTNMDISSSVVIRVGDYVAFRHAKPNDGWLCAEGLVSEDLYLNRKTDDFDNCLWEIHIQNQYSAVKEYENALSSGQVGLFELDDADGEDTHNNHDLENKNLIKRPKRNAEERAIELLNNLHKAAITEQRLNEKIMSLKVGKPVAFGDLIQLRHVKSKKFLTVSPNMLARQERENMRVVLHSRGDSTSCLLFMPRFKYDKEGQHIANNMEMYLRVHERPGEFIHAAKKNSFGFQDGRKEINCSLETSAWTIWSYQQAKEMKPKTILAGQLVTLQEPESTAFLTLENFSPGLMTESRVVMSTNHFSSGTSFERQVGTGLLWLVEKEPLVKGGPINLRVDRITFRNLNSGLFIQAGSRGLKAVEGRQNASFFECHSQTTDMGILQEDSSVQLSVNGLWISQQKQTSDGADIGCECSVDRFTAIPFLISSSLYRNLGVDLYVSVQATISLRDFEFSTRRLLNGMETAAVVGSIIKPTFSILDNMSSFLSNEGRSGQYDLDVLLEPSNKDILVQRQTMAREQGLLDVLLDIITLCEMGAYDNVRATIRRETQREGSTKLLGQSSMRKPSSSSFTANDKKIENRRLSVLGKRDSIRPQVADMAEVNVASTLDHINETISSLRRKSLTDKKHGAMEQGKTLTMSQEIAGSCLNCLLAVIRSNHINQMHVADRFPVLLNQVRDQELAVQCVQEMLHDNLQILQTKVRQREIDIFVRLLVEFEMSVTFLKLLQSTCSCPMGVDNTQRMVTNALFGPKSEKDNEDRDDDASSEDDDYRPVMLQLQSDLTDTVLVKMTWNLVDSIYFPSNSESLKDVLGHQLIANGFPKVYVVWRHNESEASDFDMLQLYNTNTMVPLESICHPRQLKVAATTSTTATGADNGGNGKALLRHAPPDQRIQSFASLDNGGASASDHFGSSMSSSALSVGSSSSNINGSFSVARNQKRRQSHLSRTTITVKRSKTIANRGKSQYDLKLQIKDFLISELYLIADLCLDRNYVAIRTLEPIFTYETLITVLVAQDIPNKFKAPICRILRCMYVDREPQVAAIFPRLIRTSISLKGGQENSFSDHHIGSPYTFSLLQQVLSDFVHRSFDATKCDELSAEIMDLLKTLLNFGFYSSQGQIKDILNPLIESLDIHKKGNSSNNNMLSLKPSFNHIDSSVKLGSDDLAPQKKTFLQRIASSTYWFYRATVWCLTCGIRGGNRQASYHEAKVIPTEEGFGGDNGGVYDQEVAENKPLTLYSFLSSISPFSSSTKRSVLSKAFAANIPWQKQWLSFTNSIRYLVLVLIAVMASIAVLILQIVLNLDVQWFDFLVIIFFGLEVGLRMYCYRFSKGELFGFFRDIYNDVDVALVLMDVVLQTIGVAAASSATRSLRAIRALRFLRLVRVFRAARLLKRLAEAASSAFHGIPTRYLNMPENEARTMINVLKILSMIYDRILDENLGTFIKAFVSWYNHEREGVHHSPLEIYKSTLQSEVDLALEIPASFDGVLIDLLMYSDSNLVQEALNLLMVHKSRNQMLFDAAMKIQIISSPKVESKYKEMNQILRELKRLAEKFEIWGELENESDYEEASTVLRMVHTLTNIIRIPNDDKTFGIRNEFIPDTEVQNLLLNMNAMNCFILVQQTLYDGGRETPKKLIVEILKATSDLIYWFVKDSPANQEAAFKHIAWFVEMVDSSISSSKVIRAILQGNRNLIKQTPKKYISDFAQKITAQRLPEYLDMFVGMTEMSREKDCSVHAVENEISRHLTGRENNYRMLLWCSAYNSSSYNERKKEMHEYLGRSDSLQEEDLSPTLQYHTSLLNLLASCNLGPKLQAIYPFEDVVQSMLDPSTIYPVKKGLGLLLHEMLKCGMDGAEYSEELWRFFQSISSDLERMQSTIKQLTKESNASNVKNRIHIGEWLDIILDIVSTFFNFFDLASFTENAFDNETNEGVFKTTQRTEAELLQVIHRLFFAIKNIFDSSASHLGTKCREKVKATLSCLCLYSPDLKFDPEEEKTHARAERRSILASALIAHDNNLHLKSMFGEMHGSHGTQISHSLTAIQRQQNGGGNDDLADATNSKSQDFYRHKFTEFSTLLCASFEKDSGSSVLHTGGNAVDLFENIPIISDNSNADVTLESLIMKLTSHIRSRLKRSTVSRTLEENCTVTTEWMLKTFRLLVEKFLLITVVDDRIVTIDDPKSRSKADINREKAEQFCNTFNFYGVTFLCLDLLSIGINTNLKVEAMKLLVIMLLKKGGNRPVQQSIFKYLDETDSVLFFESIKETLDNLLIWCQKESEQSSSSSVNSKASKQHRLDSASAKDEIVLPPEIIVFRLLQLMCDGNYLPTKNLIREQTENSRNANVIETLAVFTDKLSRQENHLSTRVAIDVIKTMLKFIQGPSKGNQEQFILHTELIVSLNRLMRSSRPSKGVASSAWAKDIEILRESIVDLLLAAIEGQPESSVVFERVATAVELNVFHVILLPSIEGELDAGQAAELMEEYELSPLQAKYLVFLQSLGDLRGTLPPFAQAKINKDIASVEIVGNGQLQSVYFHIPTIVRDISNASKDSMLSDIDCSSQERKLAHFFKVVKTLYREAQHQQFLRQFGFADMWSLKNRLTWAMFYNAVLMNILILCFYMVQPKGHEVSHSNDPNYHMRRLGGTTTPTENTSVNASNKYLYMEHDADLCLYWLTIIQICMSAATVSIFLIVRIPVTFSSSKHSGTSVIEAFIRAVFDPLPLWYFVYFLVAMLGLFENRLFLSILLLDFAILDPTTRDLLQAVQNPARQLLATFIIIVIVLNVFSGAVFYLFRDEVTTFDILSMWDSFKLNLSYGIRGEYGVSHEMSPTLGSRLILDLSFYFIVLAILRHIFFAIIVDTFGKLREQKFEREMHAHNSCFICGIERHDFDKMSVQGINNGFAYHRQNTHNPSHYMYYIMKIWESPEQDDNGIEMHVRQCMQRGDVSWFPVGITGHTSHHKDSESDHSSFLSSTHHDKIADGGATPHHSSSTHDNDFSQRLEAIQRQLSMILEGDTTRTRVESSTSLEATKQESTEEQPITLTESNTEIVTPQQILQSLNEKMSSAFEVLGKVSTKLEQMETSASKRKGKRKDAKASSPERDMSTPQGAKSGPTFQSLLMNSTQSSMPDEATKEHHPLEASENEE